MSFILDALKKSEAERQRQAGPTLLELRVTHPRHRYPIWVIVIGSLLAVNAIVLLFVALHRPSGQSGGASGAASAGAAASALLPASPPAASPPATTAAGPAALPATSSGAGSAGLSSASARPAAAAAAVAPGAVTGGTSGAAASAANGTAKAAVPPLAATADDAAGATTPHNPADDEPAIAVPPKPPTPVNYTDLPSAASLGDQVPALQLNMLVSSKDTADRYALINMHRVREGDVLPQGARVLAITPDGVAMEYQGQDFLLPRASTAPAQ